MRDDEVVSELLFTEDDATPMSTDEATIRSWSQARTCLESAPKAWLGTVRPDGRPHTVPLVLVWVDEASWFSTRPRSRKAANLVANPHCVITVASDDLVFVLDSLTATRWRFR